MEQFVISELQRATANVYLPLVGIFVREKNISQYAEVQRRTGTCSYSFIMLCYGYEPCKPELERKKIKSLIRQI